jgi:hypothetical protein
MSERIVITEDDEDLCGRATCASCRTCWRGRWCSPTERNLWYRIEKLGIPVRTPDEAPSA